MTLYFCVCVSNLTNITENVPPPPLSFWQRNKTFNGVQSLCYIMLNISRLSQPCVKLLLLLFFLQNWSTNAGQKRQVNWTKDKWFSSLQRSSKTKFIFQSEKLKRVKTTQGRRRTFYTHGDLIGNFSQLPGKQLKRQPMTAQDTIDWHKMWS